jgi:hypothetical protein
MTLSTLAMVDHRNQSIVIKIDRIHFHLVTRLVSHSSPGIKS